MRHVSLVIKKGDIILVNGRTGSGKSTLLEISCGLLHPVSGNVFWDDIDLFSISRQKLLIARHKIGFVFQVPALISNHSVFENIALPLRSRSRLAEAEITHQVRIIMEEVGLFNVERLFPESLSLGQLKAVSLARALISNPELLILDEILCGVDPDTAQGFLNVISEYQRTFNAAIIMSSHDLSIWPDLNTRKFNLESGILSNAE